MWILNKQNGFKKRLLLLFEKVTHWHNYKYRNEIKDILLWASQLHEVGLGSIIKDYKNILLIFCKIWSYLVLIRSSNVYFLS